MPSVYQPEAFSSRVNYAKRCILSGRTDSRAFDTCFEMFDGAAVATALVRKAEADDRLAKAIGTSWLAQLRESANTYAHIPTSKLSTLARELRASRTLSF